MNKYTLLSRLALLLSLMALASSQPGASQTSPTLTVPDDEGQAQPLRLATLNVDVKVVVALAMTTLDLTFYNDRDRVLEGRFSFPLGQGQSVSRFALSIDGVMREAVVVEKAKGRQVFEAIERRNIDPGLLERTAGNSFTARIFPIPAHGSKQIRIAYEEELTSTDDGLQYRLPLPFPDPVDLFTLRIDVLEQDLPPQVDPSHGDLLAFDRVRRSYIAEYERENFRPEHPVIFWLPSRSGASRVFVEEGSEGPAQRYFYVMATPPVETIQKKPPRKIGLLWDASGSGQRQEYQKVMEVLEAYFAQLGTVDVELIPFRDAVAPSETFRIEQGAWDALRERLSRMAYDGGTQLGSLDLRAYPCDVFFLVSDGVSNIGAMELVPGTTPVITLNASLTAEHGYLRYLAQSTGGVYLNLLRLTHEQALQRLTHQPYQFISARYDGKKITEVYPSIATPVDEGFSLAGILQDEHATLTLHFGVGATVLHTETIILDANQPEAGSGLVRRVWAQKKIAELDMQHQRFEEEITDLGQAYSIVTRNTSLIVLDRVEDYVEHEIVPPAALQKEYYALLERKHRAHEASEAEHLAEVVEMFEARTAWWEQTFKPPQERHPRNDEENVEVSRTPAPGRSIIRGTVIDAETGEALQGARVSIETEGLGAATDIDGIFVIRSVPPGTHTITAHFVAFQSVQTDVAVQGGEVITLRFMLVVNDMDLEEVVVDYFVSPAVMRAEAVSDNVQVSAVSARTQAGAAIALKPWSPDTPYLKILSKTATDQLYPTYLGLKPQYLNSSAFFLDVADLFNERGLSKLALRILSNIAEMELENHQLLRILAYRLQQQGYHKLAISVFEQVLTLREEEPQSYRDLGLAFAANDQHQHAIDLLYEVVRRPWDERFPAIEMIALEEMNAIVAAAGPSLDLDQMDQRLLKNLPVDVRVALTWDADNTDMDLWVVDPYGEKCFYSHKRTQIGGLMSEDFTGGYGPEVFVLKDARPGTYLVKVDYYGNTQQILAGATTIQVDLITDFGKPTEQRQAVTLRLEDVKDVIDVGVITIDAN